MDAIHPATVHFPIALLLVGSLGELWAMRRDRADIVAASRVMLSIGWWTALVATLSGFVTLALEWQRAQTYLDWINAHAATSLIIVGVYWRIVLGKPQPATTRRTLLIIGSALIVLTGWLGGYLAHTLNWR